MSLLCDLWTPAFSVELQGTVSTVTMFCSFSRDNKSLDFQVLSFSDLKNTTRAKWRALWLPGGRPWAACYRLCFSKSQAFGSRGPTAGPRTGAGTPDISRGQHCPGSRPLSSEEGNPSLPQAPRPPEQRGPLLSSAQTLRPLMLPSPTQAGPHEQGAVMGSRHCFPVEAWSGGGGVVSPAQEPG